MVTGSALDGIRVIELCHAISGPQAAQILADHGADVIKVEPPAGERTRSAMPLVDGDSTYFATHNRGKRSVTLDLKLPEDHAALMDLLSQADVVLTNYSADVPRRLGWDYDVVRDLNPTIVMAHITGFGLSGPDRELLAYDGIIQGMSGIPDITGDADGPPMFVAPFVADHLAAYRAALAIMMALRVRDATGHGTFIDVSMLEAYTAVLAHDVDEALDGRARGRTGNIVPVSMASTVACADGFVHLSPLGPVKWQAFCGAIDRPDWVIDLPYDVAVRQRRAQVQADIERWCSTRKRDEIIDHLRSHGVPCGPVWTLAEAVGYLDQTHPEAIVRVTSPTGRTVAVPAPITSTGLAALDQRTRVPRLGEHTAEILTTLRPSNPDVPAETP